MRVLVTGASGTLAPFVIRALWERHEVVLLSRRPPPAERASLPWIQGNITVFDDCWRAVQGMGAMQHLAAQPWPVDYPQLREQAASIMDGDAFGSRHRRVARRSCVSSSLSPAA